MAASFEEARKGGVRHWLPRLLLAAVVAAIAFAGWRALFFFTDDAFIAFRYAANAVAGHGLTWNPPPFRPVEGYTSFLWVVLLALVWQVTGVEPPDSSNLLSLVFGCATLLVAYRFLARMRLPEPLARHRLALGALVLLGTVSNRTFLTWLSSGLETALFNFCFTWWLYQALAPREDRGSGWAFSLSLSASSAALARPDGLLCVLGSVGILACDRLEGRGRRPSPTGWVLACTPLLIVPAHTLWRRFTYGAWLPNTYYAKHVAAWPESGLRYAASFGLEYGLWVWLLLALAWIGTAVAPRAEGRKARFPRDPAAVIAVGAVVAHAAYYTLIIGGDHFEYRVYSHLIPLLFLSALWMASRISSRAGFAAAILVSFIATSQTIPWTHWLETRHLNTRAETRVMIRPIASRFPAPLRPVVERWDGLQAWLIEHHVGTRHQEHKVFYESMKKLWGDRKEGERIRWEQRAVAALWTVGVAGWVLPEVAIIDRFGLNDRIIARAPPKHADPDERLMAHERRAPPGYVECFRPNLRAGPEGVRVEPRSPPLGDDEIRACESRDWLRPG